MRGGDFLMASSTSFKQQCPSCEAMVPIRDPALVGRKIDCPKCKYRFVVEQPEEEEDDAPASPKKKSNAVQAGKPPAKGKAKPTLRRRDEDEEEEDERPKKKKSGTSTTLILGGVLGVLALVLLVGGAIIAFANMGGPTKPDNNSTSGAGTGGEYGSGSAGCVQHNARRRRQERRVGCSRQCDGRLEPAAQRFGNGLQLSDRSIVQQQLARRRAVNHRRNSTKPDSKALSAFLCTTPTPKTASSGW